MSCQCILKEGESCPVEEGDPQTVPYHMTTKTHHVFFELTTSKCPTDITSNNKNNLIDKHIDNMIG